MRRVCFLIAVLLLGAAAWAQPLPNPTIMIDPPYIEVFIDDTFVLDVWIDVSVLGVTGYDLVIDFDETLLDVLDVNEGGLPASSPPTYFWWTDSGTPSSAIIINGAILGHSVDGPGVLAELEFRALAIGETPVSFASVDLRDLDNNPIYVVPMDGFVSITYPPSEVEPATWSRVKSLFR